jgi:hypothetical protein
MLTGFPHPLSISHWERGWGEGKGRMAPWHAVSQRERGNLAKLVRAQLQRVDPQPVHGGTCLRFGEGGKLVTEETGHALEEKRRDGDRFRHKTIIIVLCESKI